MFKGIDHIEIVPGDLEESIEFYTDVFEFEIDSRHEVKNSPIIEVVYLSLEDTTLELLKMENPEKRSRSPQEIGYRMMAIEVKDMEKALEHLKDRDIEPVWGPVSMGDTSRAEIEDPDGLRIELRDW